MIAWPVDDNMCAPSICRCAVVQAVRYSNDDWIESDEAGSTWTHEWNRDGVSTLVAFHRFVADGAVPIAWHITQTSRQAKDRAWRGQPDAAIAIFASGDESVLGSCATVQSAPKACGRALNVTLVDARLTALRLAHVVSAVLDCPGDKACASGVYAALSSVMVNWPHAPRAPPNMLALSARAPGPVARLVTANSSTCAAHTVAAVTLASGTIAVATIDPELAHRAIDEVFEGNDCTQDGQPRCTVLSRACAALWPRDTLKTPALVILCAPVGTPSIAMTEKTTRDGTVVLFSGVPLHQVLAFSHTLAFSEIDDMPEFEAPTAADVVEEMAVVARRDSATATIRRIATTDRCVRAIKARVWRPSGKLVQSMIGASVGRGGEDR